jgi:hypothetical protein
MYGALSFRALYPSIYFLFTFTLSLDLFVGMKRFFEDPAFLYVDPMYVCGVVMNGQRHKIHFAEDRVTELRFWFVLTYVHTYVLV